MLLLISVVGMVVWCVLFECSWCGLLVSSRWWVCFIDVGVRLVLWFISGVLLSVVMRRLILVSLSNSSVLVS